MKKQLIFLLIIFAFVTAGAQIKKPLVSAITDKDLRTDMYQIAADQFNGREAGTLDELKVAVWLANKAKEAGIKPAGDNGTYFQFYDMYRHQVLPASFVKLGNKSYKLWQEVLVTEVNPSKVEAPVLFLGSASPEEVA
ncbi:MAG TPA: peptidase M28, partial [Chitinophagaceae bacterium]|nr:peptidase M28 [Chitinophagaceae bacterium]